MHELPRKHQKKEKPPTQEKGKVVDLESDEGMQETRMDAKDIDVEGVDPISKLPQYIPPCEGEVKVPKDPDEGKFLLNTLLLLD